MHFGLPDNGQGKENRSGTNSFKSRLQPSKQMSRSPIKNLHVDNKSSLHKKSHSPKRKVIVICVLVLVGEKKFLVVNDCEL